MIDHDLDQNVSKFLTNEDLTALQFVELQRRAAIAEALAAQAKLLIHIGMSEERIQPVLDNVREQLNGQSAKAINKFQKAVYKQLAVLGDVPMPLTVNLVTTIEAEAGEVIETTPAKSVEAEVITVEEVAPEVIVSNESSVEELIDESAESIDEKLKRVPLAIKNVYGKLLTSEDIASIADFDEEKVSNLVNLFEESYKRYARRQGAEMGALQGSRLRMVFEGKSYAEIADIENVHHTSIARAFRTTVPEMFRPHKHEIAEQFARVREGLTVEYPEKATKKGSKRPAVTIKPTSESAGVTLVAGERKKHSRLERPEGLSLELNALFGELLTFEQRTQIATLSSRQKEELVSVIDRIHSRGPERAVAHKDIHMSRLEQMLDGVSANQIEINEGKAPHTIYQSFKASLPKIYMPFREELSREFDRIVASETVATVTAAPIVEQVAPITQEQTEKERAPEEPLIEKVKNLVGSVELEVEQGISELLYVGEIGRYAVPVSDRSVKAAQYLDQLVREKGISLERTIANPTTRASIERLLSGVKRGENRIYTTFSGILRETPPELRQHKFTSVSTAFQKIALQIEGTMPVKQENPLEVRADQIRGRLGSVLGLEQNHVDQLVNKALDKNVEQNSDLGKNLIGLLRKGMEVQTDLPEKGILVLRSFTMPRPQQPAMTVTEIKQHLAAQDPANKSVYENGFVTEALLKSFEVIIEKADK